MADSASPPQVDFSILGNLYDTYNKAQQQGQQQRALQNFSGDMNDPQSLSALGVTLMRAGNLDQGFKLLQLGQQVNDTNVFTKKIGEALGGQQQGAPTPSPSATPGIAGPPTGRIPVPSTNRVVGDQEGVDLGYYDPRPGERPPPPNSPSGPGVGAPAPVGSTATPPQQPPMVAQAPMGAPPQMAGGAPPSASPMPVQTQAITPQARLQAALPAIMQKTTGIAATPGQTALGMELLKQVMNETASSPEKKKAIESGMGTPFNYEVGVKNNELTPELKAFQAGRKPGENLVDFNARQAATSAGAKDEATKLSTSMDKLRDEGLQGKEHIAQLDTLQSLGDKVGYGIIPKVQSVLGNYGIETKGLTDIQAYERAVAFMAPQLRSIGSGRLLQNELNAFKSALGGLMTTPEGRRISVENLKLLSQYKAQVGEIAGNTELSAPQRWQQIYQLPPPKLATRVPEQAQGGGGGATSVTPPIPRVGDVQKGHRYIGGNPASPSSWQAQ